ncbi:threonine/serine exporter family protein [Nocardioides sp. 616]|uniref:threonine/serine ThrE exporter family protein n=1 Tax=Nocardioides sp. 616 TaxID=2268090 RepID=UPI001F07119D|nr:threonine/serine exporter family protein [Nocardioides sp. 616]
MSAEPDVKELNLTLDLCLRIGEMLLANGAGAADVTATMGAVAHHLGLRTTDIDVTFTQVSMGYQYDPAAPTLLMIRQVKQRDIDYEDLTQVDHLVRDLLHGKLDLYLARTRMASIVSVGHPVPRWAVTIATGVMCAAVALFLGGDLAVIAIAFLAAACIDRVQLRMSRRRLPNFYLQVAGGVVATLFAVGAAASGLDVDPSLVVTANIIMLLAGIGFMGALQDALSGFYVTAGARIIEALLATSGIIAGVSGGLSLGTLMGVDVGQLEPGRSGWQDLSLLMVGSALCAAAFAFSCYSPKRALVPIALVAAGAAAIFRLVDEADLGRTWAAAFAAFAIGLVAYAVAGRVRVPPLVVVVPAIVPLLPGLSIYRGLSLMAADNGASTSAGLLAMVTAASVAIALASGVILGEYVAQPVKREARRLEQRLSGPRLVGVFRARSKR